MFRQIDDIRKKRRKKFVEQGITKNIFGEINVKSMPQNMVKMYTHTPPVLNFWIRTRVKFTIKVSFRIKIINMIMLNQC